MNPFSFRSHVSALRKTVVGLVKMIPIAAALLGGGLILFALSRVLWLSMILLLFTGFGMMQVATACNTIIQTIVPEDKRGRAMSYYTMAFVGTVPWRTGSALQSR
jgi:MFS family permease